MLVHCQIDIAWHEQDEMRSDDEKGHWNYKCGVKDPIRSSGSKARIFNGKSTHNKEYPWLADIINVRGKGRNDNGVKSISTGSIISHRIILTCLHCVCSDVSHTKDKQTATCLRDKPEENTSSNPQSPKPQNQNREGNIVYYHIGTMRHGGFVNQSHITEPEVNEDVKVYLHRYTPQWKKLGKLNETKWIKSKEDNYGKLWAENIFYKYGDISIIINTSKNGLNLHLYKAIPICLPNPEDSVFKGEDTIKVTIVGRGEQYVEGKEDPKINTCLTNEGLLQRKDQAHTGAQHIFLPCKDYVRREPPNSSLDNACLSLEKGTITRSGTHQQVPLKTGAWYGEKIKSISAFSTITFVPSRTITPSRFQVDPPSDNARANELCQHYWKKAEQTLTIVWDSVLSPGENTDWDSTVSQAATEPDRIVVFEQDKTDVEDGWKKSLATWEKRPSEIGATCYNLAKLARNGICRTEEDLYPWGFCGPSCGDPKEFPRQTPIAGEYRPYNEMNAIYYEKTPSTQGLS